MNPLDFKQCAMPLTSRSFGPGPYRFINREFLIITYKTDMDALRRVVPDEFEIPEPIVKYEFIRMADGYGFGNYTESGQVIPVTYKGEAGGYVHCMFLDNFPATAGGREIWGFPKKLGTPRLTVENDVLQGTLDHGNVRVATGTMNYKYNPMDQVALMKSLKQPNFMLKAIPHVDNTPRILELVKYYLVDIELKEAWTGAAALHLVPHVAAPVADLPIREVVGGAHFIADLSLSLGEVVHDYLAK